MNETTKNILLAVGTVVGIVLIFFLINRYKRMQALKRMREQQNQTAATIQTTEVKPTITGITDWNNSKVATNINFGFFTWFGEITPTTYKTETRANQVIKITGGASSSKIELLKDDKVVKEANIDFYNEKLNGFN